MKQDAAVALQMIRQFSFETESWGRMLAFWLEELVYFKNRLVEIIPSSEGEDDLLVLESFQEQFLAQEKIIAYLMTETKEQTKLLEKDLYVEGELLPTVIKNQKKLRREMIKADGLFAGLKGKFVQFLVSRY